MSPAELWGGAPRCGDPAQGRAWHAGEEGTEPAWLKRASEGGAEARTSEEAGHRKQDIGNAQ